jgi:hypothetical protein
MTLIQLLENIVAKLELNLTAEQKEALKNLIKSGNFAHTRKRKMVNAVIKEMAHKPQPSDAPLLRKAFLTLLSENRYLYCDYGNDKIDLVFKALELPYRSSVHCPQKAGTDIVQNDDGGYRVEVATGYGHGWETLG